MSRVLQLGSLKAGDINFDNLALLASLEDPDSQVKLTIANSLWINLSKHPLLPAFAVPTLTSLPHTMAIDHPFFYAVTDEETGALLFIGTLVKPT